MAPAHAWEEPFHPISESEDQILCLLFPTGIWEESIS